MGRNQKGGTEGGNAAHAATATNTAHAPSAKKGCGTSAAQPIGNVGNMCGGEQMARHSGSAVA